MLGLCPLTTNSLQLTSSSSSSSSDASGGGLEGSLSAGGAPAPQQGDSFYVIRGMVRAYNLEMDSCSTRPAFSIAEQPWNICVGVILHFLYQLGAARTVPLTHPGLRC